VRLTHCNENLNYRLADNLQKNQTEFKAAEEYFINAILPPKRAFYQKRSMTKCFGDLVASESRIC